MDLNYEQDLAMDPHELDEEWLRQPVLYMAYSEELAKASKVYAYAKEDLDVFRAELDKRIRLDPKAHTGLDKATETAIAGAILMDKDYRERQAGLIELRYRVDILSSAVKAFEHRKKALEKEVDLCLAGYYAGPKEPRSIGPGKRFARANAVNESNEQREKLRRKRNSG